MPWYAMLIWAFLLGIVAFIFIKQQMGKRAYKDKDMSVDFEWFEKSRSMYPKDDTVCQYYMHPDKNFSNQGHVVVDRDDRVIYEEKVLYATVIDDYEVDFVNHLLGYTHHHKIGHATTCSAGIGGEDGGLGFNLSSSFDFDGVPIWEYIQQKGYHYAFHLHGLAYTVSLYRGEDHVGTIYSSNNGKNYYKANGTIQPKMGTAGYYVLEGCNEDLDALVLLSIAFIRTELNPQSISG